MARLFLQDRYQTTTGGSGRGISMLFEMNTLFEDYVGRQVARALVGTGFTVSLQSGRLFCLSADDGRGLFQTKPDILLRRAGVVTHVIATQWKRIAPLIDEPQQGFSQDHVYQLMAYSQLFHAPRPPPLSPH